jgi:hypothetical protein
VNRCNRRGRAVCAPTTTEPAPMPPVTLSSPSPSARSATHAPASGGARDSCPDTGRMLPECGCAGCGRRLVARHAPHLAGA